MDVRKIGMAKKKNSDHVVLGGGPNEVGYCTHCGVGMTCQMPMEMGAFIRAMGRFADEHAKCPPAKKDVLPPNDETMTPMQWRLGRDTGTSSCTIWSVMNMLGPVDLNDRYDIPYDPADFGRCYRMLKLFPTWRMRLHEVSTRFPEWFPFVRNWSELERMYEHALSLPDSNDGGAMYKYMQKLVKVSQRLKKRHG